jgi:hypothetical protein
MSGVDGAGPAERERAARKALPFDRTVVVAALSSSEGEAKERAGEPSGGCGQRHLLESVH